MFPDEGSISLDLGSEPVTLGQFSVLSPGASTDAPDYDGRTPLHLAVAEGQKHVVEFFESGEALTSGSLG